MADQTNSAWIVKLRECALEHPTRDACQVFEVCIQGKIMGSKQRATNI
jgi:hypothetical protein